MSDQEPESTAGREVERLRRELRVRHAERLMIARGLAEARADIERVGRSRAWRWGHAAARLLARLSRRPVLTRGAIAHALDRLGRMERILTAPDEPRRSGDGRISFCVKLAAASRDTAPLGGDFHFATAVARELGRRGHHARVAVLPEEEDAGTEAEEVVIVLRGRARHTPRAAQLNVLWVISHPTELLEAECDGYDLVCVASEGFAATLREQTTTPVIVLHQATDPELFHPGRSAGAPRELVFVGNSRGVRRKILDDLLPTSRTLAVYGNGWNGIIDAGYVVASHVPNDQLHEVYSSAALVLNDHWEDMRANGFISNRLYDAVACGALVLSDPVDGIDERFGGAVVTYETREQLAALIELFVADPVERAARGSAGRRRVLSAHTFAHRVDSLLEAVGERAAALGFSPAVEPIEQQRE